ncbi:MAG: lysophospholipid acyltransferase family protein [Thermoanaerobaculia bacterium]
MKSRLFGFLVFLLVGLFRLTLRLRLVGRERRDMLLRSGVPIVYALWHQRMIIPILTHGFQGNVTMASRSRDGEVIAAFLRFWGFRVVRGSSSRGGGEAMRELIASMRSGAAGAAMTTDGPRGPARRSKPGVLRIAEELGAVIIPTASSCRKPRFLSSWDNYLVPLPFSQGICLFGEPLLREKGEPEETFLSRLDRAIDAATEEADRLCGVKAAPRGRQDRAKGETDDA